MEIVWTPTYTAILAAIISSSLLIIFLEPILNYVRRKRLYHGWQAVFLSNNQVYFGKIKSVTRDDIKLADIYYLRIQEGSFSGDDPDNPFEEQPGGLLVKLGSEVHGPEDVMVIGRSHIMFIENMQSKYAPVPRAIEEFRKNEKRAKDRRFEFNKSQKRKKRQN